MTSGNASKWNIPACLYQQGRLALVTCSPHCHSEVPSLVWPRSTSSVHGVLCTLRSQLVPLPVHCSTAQTSHIPTVRASHSLTPVTFHGGKSSLSQRDGRLFEDRDHVPETSAAWSPTALRTAGTTENEGSFAEGFRAERALESIPLTPPLIHHKICI